ncbi:signal peptidase I [Croceibacterium ferulae]|uniref:signal peptidase I n=1 Tax=Croceibacterium ferulae TaxID=1854641 RepID=UPI000EACD776|nr:signal peptidase I [Croceibacterium ferulae]
MSDTATTPADTPAPPPAKPKKEEDSLIVFLLKLVVIVLIFRTLIFSSFSIPSESMMPRLLEGDYLFAAKWPYGYSQASMPFDLPLVSGRVPAGMPDRGDVAVFKHPVDRVDYIKRVIGLPGDQVQMVNGVLHLNGDPVRKVPAGALVVSLREGGRCAEPQFEEAAPDGTPTCRYPRFRETLPNGVSYEVLDFGLRQADTTQTAIVPEGHLFMMGDNRDNSLDSRFPAIPGQGVGLVPVENVVGRASFVFFSTDGSAEWLKPWTWFTAARWSRIGRGI